MRIERIERGAPSEGSGRLRLSARVAYDDGCVETLWFEVPEALADRVTERADPWLAGLLPLAVTRGETLRIEAGGIDGALLARVRELMRLWACWHPGLAPVPIEAEVESAASAAPIDTVPGSGPGSGPGNDGAGDDAAGEPTARADAALFSGGIDSLYTVLCDRKALPPGRRVVLRELLTVHGFDVPLARAAAFERLRARHERFADRLGLRSVAIATNLRATRFAEADWARLAHGPALAASALVLAPGLRTVLIAASSGYRDLRPWGSHPLVDPLLSTSGTRFVHDGAEVRRLDKLGRVCRSEAALSVLRVCWESETDQNCGRCLKCSRTLAGLELLGARPRAPTFAHTALDLDRIASLRPRTPWEVREWTDLRTLAARLGRTEIEAAVAEALEGGADPAGADGRERGGIGALVRRLVGRGAARGRAAASEEAR